MKITIPGKGDVEARPVPFTSGGDMMGSVLLDDGTVLAVRVIVTEVLKMEGLTDALGRQAYFLQHATLVVPA